VVREAFGCTPLLAAALYFRSCIFTRCFDNTYDRIFQKSGLPRRPILSSIATLGAMLGFAIMMMLDVALG
jgi:hypothetical protein